MHAIQFFYKMHVGQVRLTVASIGPAGTDLLCNLVCGLCLAPWMVNSRHKSSHTHTSPGMDIHTSMHACLDAIASPVADGNALNGNVHIYPTKGEGLWKQHVCLPLCCSNILETQGGSSWCPNFLYPSSSSSSSSTSIFATYCLCLISFTISSIHGATSFVYQSHFCIISRT